MGPEALAHTRALDRRILEEGTTYKAEETLEINGVERTFQTVKFPLLDEDGRATAVVRHLRRYHRPQGGIAAARRAGRRSDRRRSKSCSCPARRRSNVSPRRSSCTISPPGMHVDQMARVAAMLATRLGLDAERVDLLRLAAPMHDVGKIATPSEILRKPGPLTPASARRWSATRRSATRSSPAPRASCCRSRRDDRPDPSRAL